MRRQDTWRNKSCSVYEGGADLHKEQEDQCQAHVETPQSAGALAPWLQAGDDPTEDMHDARCCVEVSHVINFIVMVRVSKRDEECC